MSWSPHDHRSSVDGHVPHANYPDNPPVAATEDGGPAEGPGLLERPHKYAFECVPGLFLQTGPKPKHVEFEDILHRSFGLLDTSPDRWHNLVTAVERLQADAPEGVTYKVMFLGRHGQGWHNFAAAKYSVDAWEEHWTYLFGDGKITWGPDPALTPLGEEQTRAIRAAWGREVDAGAPVDRLQWLVSPLQRCCQTHANSWDGLVHRTPEIWEDWREIYGSHTCDQRSTRTTISQRFPKLAIEPGFTETDELWKADERETDEHMQLRMHRAMDRLFDGDYGQWISVTAHGAILRNLLAVLGHQAYPLATSEVLPVVVRATPLARCERPGEGGSRTAVNGSSAGVNGA